MKALPTIELFVLKSSSASNTSKHAASAIVTSETPLQTYMRSPRPAGVRPPTLPELVHEAIADTCSNLFRGTKLQQFIHRNIIFQAKISQKDVTSTSIPLALIGEGERLQ
jgi:hypothetical protein